MPRLGVERGHRTLRIVGKGNKPATVPLVPRTAWTIDLAVGDCHEGPIFRRRDGQRLDRRTAHRWVRLFDRLPRARSIAVDVDPVLLTIASATFADDDRVQIVPFRARCASHPVRGVE